MALRQVTRDAQEARRVVCAALVGARRCSGCNPARVAIIVFRTDVEAR